LLVLWHRVSAEEQEKQLAALAEFVRARGADQADEQRVAIAEFIADLRKNLPPGELRREIKAAPSGVTREDGLPPGVYCLTADLGGEGPRIELARADVELVAGHTTSITLSLAALPPLVEPAPLAGTLSIPLSWEYTDPVLQARLMVRAGGMSRAEEASFDIAATRIPERLGLYAWDAGRITPGRYLLELRRPRFTWQIDVPPEGNAKVRLQIPRPAHVSVKLLDAESGAGIDPMYVSWSHVRAGELAADGSWMPIMGASFQAPIGRVTITARSQLHEDVSSSVDLTPGQNEVTLRAPRACGLILDATVDEQPVDWPFHVNEVTVTRIDGSGGIDWYQVRGRQCTIPLAGAGRYRLDGAESPLYRPIPPHELDIVRGEFVRHTLRLERKPLPPR
jgi:hypothetical protein